MKRFRERCEREGFGEPNEKLYAPIVAELFNDNRLSPTVVEIYVEKLQKLGIEVDLKQSLADRETGYMGAFEEPLLECFMEFIRITPKESSPFKVPAHEVMTLRSVKRAFDVLAFRKYAKIGSAHIDLFLKLYNNVLNQSVAELGEAKVKQGKGTTPTDFKGTVRDAARAYFKDTPLLKLFEASMPIALTSRSRLTHEWVVAPTGTGKTQLLQAQIARDLDKVVAGEVSLIVMDSQGMGEGRLLSNIASLNLFAPGQPLHDRLVILEPDPDAPLALNLFDMGQYNSDLSGRDRQILHTSALKMITFCLSDTTGQQQDMIEYLVQLAMAVPGATIDTVRKMLQYPKAEFLKVYEEQLGQVDEVVRDYFLHTFHVQNQNVTKEAVTRRIMGMLKNPTFRKMYQSERNKFSMQRELEAGKVILINTDVALMGQEACELFGRFFIALLLQATQQRKANNTVYCYIDECTDYISNDENIAVLIDKARKQNVGFVFAHQRLAQIKSSNVLDALSNCAIQFAGRNRTDAPALARLMRTTPEFIMDTKTGQFAAFVQDQTPSAVLVNVEGFVMENMAKMDPIAEAEIRKQMRDRYCHTPASSRLPSTRTGEWDDVV